MMTTGQPTWKLLLGKLLGYFMMTTGQPTWKLLLFSLCTFLTTFHFLCLQDAIMAIKIYTEIANGKKILKTPSHSINNEGVNRPSPLQKYLVCEPLAMLPPLLKHEIAVLKCSLLQHRTLPNKYSFIDITSL